jgi:hypothetical protein
MTKRDLIILLISQITIILIVSYFLVIYLPVSLEGRNMKDMHEVEFTKLPGKFGKYNLEQSDEKALKNMIRIIEADQDINSVLFMSVNYISYFLIGILIVSLSQCTYLIMLYKKRHKNNK